MPNLCGTVFYHGDPDSFGAFAADKKFVKALAPAGRAA
jgi:hypothetical protein